MSKEKKAPYIRVGFETWYWGPNTEAAKKYLKDSLTADMATCSEWLDVQVVEDPDGEVGHISDYVWDALDVVCPHLKEEEHGIDCTVCRGDESYTPDWTFPQFAEGWPDWSVTTAEQGWSRETVRKLALGFISEQGIMHKFERFCREMAEKANRNEV